MVVSTGEGHHNPDDDVLQIVKRGSSFINRHDIPDPQYWGTYSAAQVSTLAARNTCSCSV
jgi:hypothetical protein